MTTVLCFGDSAKAVRGLTCYYIWKRVGSKPSVPLSYKPPWYDLALNINNNILLYATLTCPLASSLLLTTASSLTARAATA